MTGAGGQGWERRLPALLLEIAYVWAEDRAKEVSASVAAREAAKEVRRLDDEILATTARLRDLLNERNELQEKTGIRSSWAVPGLDIWEAIETASRWFPEWSRVCKGERSAFLRVATEQSRPGPELADVLQAVALSEIGEPYASHGDDAASLALPSGAAHDSPAAWLRRFLAQMDESMCGLQLYNCEHRALDWLTSRGIADLLTVADGRQLGEPPFTLEMVKKNRQRFIKELEGA